MTALLLVLAAFCSMLAYVYAPAWLNLQTVHEIVRGAAIQWYATEEKAAAEDELIYRLEKEGFEYIDENNCDVFREGQLLVARCRWEYYAYYPFDIGYGHLHFSSTAKVDTTGGVDQTGGLGKATWFNQL